MLLELAVRDLGVIADLRLVLGAGMTAVTGETGAGKTLVVEAIELLVGGRADAVMVRPGAEEAWVEGRFVIDDEEVVLARAVPRSGRSRAYVDGRLATAGALTELGARLVDLHGQHAHQSLLATSVQRDALDRFGAIDLDPLIGARAEVASIRRDQAALGGDERARAREIDLLRFQVRELADAQLSDPDEDVALDAEEDALSGAVVHQQAAISATDALMGERAAADSLGVAIAAIAGRAPFAAQEVRLRAAAADLADIASDIRSAGEAIGDDPERLELVRQRRQLLADLRRKYGADLTEVLAFREEAAARLGELEDHDRRAAELDVALAAAEATAERAAAAVARARRKAAPALATAVQEHLVELAMPKARMAIAVEGDGPADAVAFLLSANPGAPELPLAKIASGGELARVMLALRLVLSAGPPTLIFDEVDAGVGGSAALAVGRSLATLGAERQVLVVTHLPQVAAFADAQLVVRKIAGDETTVAEAEIVDGGDRVIELSRMLSGQPESRTARDHAEELLASAAAERGR